MAGSYGLAPSGLRLPEDTRLGPVCLQVADLSRSLEYYRRVVGLEPLGREEDRAMLGTPSGTELVELHEHRGATPAPGRGRTGLYHFALLLPDRDSLGRFARHLAEIGERAGSADHFVSEAFYLQDPDNLGIEVYADRPRRTWQRIGRELVMGTEPIDMAGLLRAGADEPWEGAPTDTVMGHVHLHVGDLQRATAFYSEGLGFDRMVQGYPGALFLGAGGYHHHLGTNTWAGHGATPPAIGDAQLLEWTIELPEVNDLKVIRDHLEQRGITFEHDEESNLRTRDPWGTAVRLGTS